MGNGARRGVSPPVQLRLLCVCAIRDESWRGLRPQPVVEIVTQNRVVIRRGTQVAEKLMAEK